MRFDNVRLSVQYICRRHKYKCYFCSTYLAPVGCGEAGWDVGEQLEPGDGVVGVEAGLALPRLHAPHPHAAVRAGGHHPRPAPGSVQDPDPGDGAGVAPHALHQLARHRAPHLTHDTLTLSLILTLGAIIVSG